MSTTLASTSARSYSSDTIAFNRPMYAPSSTGVQVLTTSFTEILRNDLTAGEVIADMLFCNRADDGNFSVCLVPQGGTAGDTNLIYDEVPIEGGETVIPPFKPNLRAGDSLWMKSNSADTVNVVVNYLSEQ